MEEPSTQDYLQKMQGIQKTLLNYIEENGNTEENLHNLISILEESKICENKHELQSLLHLISKIGNNHHRGLYFFDKIDRIFIYLKDYIKKYFLNSEIFNIFKSNKRLLLFFIEERIMIFDNYIARIITTTDKYINAKYPQYFQPELQPFINEKWFPKHIPNSWDKRNLWVEDLKKELPENFYSMRKTGEKESLICEYIRKDLIDDFIVYVNKNNVQFNALINPSIYETNSFLIKDQDKELTLIKYAAFFGSIQIFNYLRMNKVELDSSLWPYAIHGENAEIIHYLESNHINPEDKKYLELFQESIKCHHNDIAKYFLDNFLENTKSNSIDFIDQNLKYYNYNFLQNEHINESLLFSLCKYDHYILIYNLMKNEDININKKLILFSIKHCLNPIFQCGSKLNISLQR